MKTFYVVLFSIALVSCTKTPDAPNEVNQNKNNLSASNKVVNTNEDVAVHVRLNEISSSPSPVVYALLRLPEHGTLSGTSPDLTYTPAQDFNGSDSFSFQVVSGEMKSNTAEVIINVGAVLDAPVAQNAELSTNEDSTASGTLLGKDPDGGTLVYSIVVNGTKGTARITDPSTGAFNYEPSKESNGTDLFGFKVTRGSVSSMVGAVLVTIAPVNDAPTANSATLAVTEDITKTGTLTASDIDGDALTYSIVSNGAKGTATITNAGTGTFSYQPSKDLNGTDTFTFKVNDGNADSNIATVTVTIAPVNDAPIANDTTLAVKIGDNTLRIPATDADGDLLTFEVVTAPLHGILTGTTLAPQYRPSHSCPAADSFSYRVVDIHGAYSDTATIELERGFGTEGKQSLSGIVNFQPTNVSLLPDEKILIGGIASVSIPGQTPPHYQPSTAYNVGISRLNCDGTRDTSYTASAALTRLETSARILAMANDSTGKTVLLVRFIESIEAIRVLPNGGVDTSFGTGGRFALSTRDTILSNPATGFIAGAYIYVSEIGNRVVGAYPFFSRLKRFTMNGVLDTSFGNSGAYETAVMTDFLAQNDGRLALLGTQRDATNSCSYPSVVRPALNGQESSDYLSFPTLCCTTDPNGPRLKSFQNRLFLSYCGNLLGIDGTEATMRQVFAFESPNSNQSGIFQATDSNFFVSLVGQIAKYTASGVRDQSFGSSGSLVLGAQGLIQSVVNLTDKSIALYDGSLFKFNADGTLSR